MQVTYITHPDVVVDPNVPVERWPLSLRGKERMAVMLSKPIVQDFTAIYCSSEQKAIDGAAILAEHLKQTPIVRDDLGENDRSSTGFLEEEIFRAHVLRFFATPEDSIEGWEPAAHAQARVVGAVREIAASEASDSHIAIVGHGGVGSLLLTSLRQDPISGDNEQPGRTGGNFFSFDPVAWEIDGTWQAIDG